MLKTFTLLMLTCGLQNPALAQYPPALPPGPPEKKVDPGMVQKSAEALLKACRSAKERELKGKGSTNVTDRAKDICFCIAKDLRRRDDTDEMSFMTKYIQDKFDDDHVFTEEQDLWLHEFSKTEKNCGVNPKYRFGMAESRPSGSPELEQSIQQTQTKPVTRKGQVHARGIAGLFHAVDNLPPAPIQIHPAIYNGTEIHKEPLKHFPRFMVLIESTTNNGKTSYCTGTALASDVILTAGHCVNNSQSVRVKIMRSTNPIKYTTIEAKDWKAHPKTNGGFEGPQLGNFTNSNASQFNDIGLIVLSEASSDVEPITLAPANFNPAGSGSWMFVFGQGRNRQYQPTGKLEFGELRATERISDSSLYIAKLKEKQGWCVRDSGGPVTVGADGVNGGHQHYLLGVAFAFFDGFQSGDQAELKKTWGDLQRVPRCGSRVMYSLIGSETAWIEKTLKEMLPGESRPLLYF
jgi:hypothetical protein